MQTLTLTHVLHYERAMWEFEYITRQVDNDAKHTVYQVRDMTSKSCTVVHVDDNGVETVDTVVFDEPVSLSLSPHELAVLTSRRKALSHELLREGWDMVSDTFKDGSPGFNMILMYTWTVTFQREVTL